MKHLDPRRLAVVAGILVTTSLLPGCGVRVSTLRIEQPDEPGQAAYRLISDKSSLDTIADRLRDETDAPVIVSLDAKAGWDYRFSGTATGNSWAEVFEDVLRQTGVTYTKKNEVMPVFHVPKQSP